MARETFIDTSGFYALLVRGDDKHAAAEAWLKRAEKQRARAVTTDYVLDETATLVKTKGYGHLLKGFFDRLEGSEAVRVEWTDQRRFQHAKEFFLQYADHAYSFTDCVSFVVMRLQGLREALTKDKHFREAGFTALLLG
jgi:predicted nucleic acid-binding protein